MASLVSNHSYSHTHHFVSQKQFDGYIEGLLNSDKLSTEKKPLLQALIKTDIWKEIQQSSYWRHNIFNGGLSGPFTEYFACFNPEWKIDFWGARVQSIDVTYLSEHAIPRAYQSAVLKTRQIVSEKVRAKQENIAIASLACGTMYDVFGASYEDRKKVTFWGYDVDGESLKLAKEKAQSLKYDPDQVKICECDVVHSSLPTDQFDIVVCNGFSFYINDESLCQVVEKVKKSLKTNGIFVMSFIQPSTLWQMSEEEKKVGKIVKDILDAVPMNWSAHLRTSDQVLALVKKSGLADATVIEEGHGIHPLILAKNG